MSDSAPDDDDKIDDFDRFAVMKRLLGGRFSSFDDDGSAILMPTFGEGLFKKFETVQFPAIGAEHPLDFMTTSQKWHAYLAEALDQEAPSPKLVAALTTKHAELFQVALDPYETAWDGMSGMFAVSTKLWASWAPHSTGLAAKGAVFTLWADAFEQTVLDHYDDFTNGSGT